MYQGTLRGRPDEILVFTNLLAHADSTGLVDKHWRAISEEIGISRERVEAAILILESPDPESRSPEQDGRRIVRIDDHRAWGWQIVNHGKYRAIKNEDDRREQNRLAQERWRNKQNKQRKPRSAQAEAEAEAEAEADKKDTYVGFKEPTPVDQALEIYNEAAKRVGWTNARKLTEPRRRNLKARLSECGGIDGWREAIAKAEASDFLTGRTAPGNGHEGGGRTSISF